MLSQGGPSSSDRAQGSPVWGAIPHDSTLLPSPFSYRPVSLDQADICRISSYCQALGTILTRRTGTGSMAPPAPVPLDGDTMGALTFPWTAGIRISASGVFALGRFATADKCGGVRDARPCVSHPTDFGGFDSGF